jgi:hypothetical protein
VVDLYFNNMLPTFARAFLLNHDKPTSGDSFQARIAHLKMPADF